MGINNNDVNFISSFLKINDKILELGQQQYKTEKKLDLKKWKNGYSSKEYFEKYHNVFVDSIDLIFEESKTSLDHNFINYDLSTPFTEKFYNHYDIVTNYGTTEHVGQFHKIKSKNNPQYIVFKNIHDSLKVNGIAIHNVPSIDKKHAHGAFNYDHNFFDNICIFNNYEKISMHYEKRSELPHISYVIKKLSNDDFILHEEFLLIPGIKPTSKCPKFYYESYL